MASPSVTNPVTIYAHIVSDLLVKLFSFPSITEQNVIVKERPTTNLTIKNKGDHLRRSGFVRRISSVVALPWKRCWPCLLFSPGTALTWTRNVYNDMRSSMSDGKKHEKGKSHLPAFKTWKTYGANVWVDSLLSQARRDEIQRQNEEVRQNREILKTVTDAVLYLFNANI